MLFDGEEATDDSRPFIATGLRGSTAYAKRHAGEVRALILLDFVAAENLRIPREANSDRGLWSRLRAAAQAVGAGAAFPPGTGDADHRRPLAVPRARRPGDRPDPVALRLLAPALRRPPGASASARST